MKRLQSLAEAEDLIFNSLGNAIHMATPLGLGKPNQLINQVFDRAARSPQTRLKIFTALSLDFADPASDIEARFLGPFYKRHFGDDYPHLKYVRAVQKNQLPKNISLHEFYFQAGAFLKSYQAQQNYISLNYTHVAPAILQHDINVVVQLISKSAKGPGYSLSCNPDLTLDVIDLYKKHGKSILKIGVVHPDLPYVGGDAEVAEDFFDAILESDEINHQLFALPKTSADEIEHMIGFYASHLVKDGGTLQIGIGSLSDALVHSTIMRHERNDLYKRIGQQLGLSSVNATDFYREPFKTGLYGTSEMLMDGFMHLRKAGILIREIFDHDEKARRYLHGAFYLGSKDFYAWLRGLKGPDHEGLSMTRVSKINDLYDPHEMALRRQRKDARFFNTCMSVTLLGGAASDTLEDGNVVSGVGGQYNFVAMAHELENAQSILMLRSVREKNGKRFSNIIPMHGQLTIPRHLRDIVITEYGIAFLRGESDETVIQRLIEISDSEFQGELIEWAKKNKKLSVSYELPERAKNNTPAKVKSFIQGFQKEGVFAAFPFGSDYTEEEIAVGKALLKLKHATLGKRIGILLGGLLPSAKSFDRELDRLDLKSPKSVKEIFFQKLVLGALGKIG
ncbi:acetyl-CoA hydrolase [Bdellovibrio bacteriovorus]|uniref:Acetyl-CoA hydrolase n=1 Tax=Bdellovibrio bacteriovorus TaxID=959 RepID=A0A150WJK0_BDEBC|nr:acetyl-CoA hydrolase/transferase C-terminal domain-containing protein [Bdellovibrio bacteriovorus]KYG63967.1 acetyl-CoA hydrolase [Bdellovibrio bacteriovorus]